MKRTRITAALVLVAIVLSLFSYAIASGDGAGESLTPCTQLIPCAAEGCTAGHISVTCNECDGEGEIDCTACGGEGEITCSTCNGSGEGRKPGRKCRDCDGEGKIDCTTCGGDEEIACPTCGGNKQTQTTCEACGGKGGTTPCTGHLTTTTSATCTEAGSAVTSCNVCGYTTTTAIGAAGHTFEDDKCATCGATQAPPESTELTQAQKKMLNDKVYLAVYKLEGAYPNEPDVYGGENYTFYNSSYEDGHWFANNAKNIISEDLFSDPDYIPGDGVSGLADSTGTATLQYLFNIDWNRLILAVKGSHVDPNDYKVIPYVIKHQTRTGPGWHIDCAVVEKSNLTVYYNANGVELKADTSLPLNHSIPAGGSITVGAGLTADDSNLEFLGWSTDPKATEASYQPDDSITNIQSNMTLYAIWKDNTKPEPVRYGAGYFVLKPELAVPESGLAASYYLPLVPEADQSKRQVDWSTGYIGYITQAAKDTLGDDYAIKISSEGSDYASYLIQPTAYSQSLLNAVRAANGDQNIQFEDLVIEWYEINQADFSATWPEINGTTGPGYHVDGYVKGVKINVVYYPNHSGSEAYKEVLTNDQGGELLSGNSHTILSYAGTELPAYAGYTFKGWNTKANGSGTSYTVEQAYTLQNGLALYAQWEKNAPTTAAYTVAYYYGAGDDLSTYTQTTAPEGAPTGDTVAIGAQVTLSNLPATLTVNKLVYAHKSTDPATLTVTLAGPNEIKVYYDLVNYTTSYSWGASAPAGANIPANGSGFNTEAAAIASKDTSYTADTVVYDANGKWTFSGWTQGTTENRNVPFTGTWTFTAASVEENTASFTVKKVDDAGDPLTGAGFTLIKGEQNYAATVNEAGTEFTFSGLTEGSYTLTESATPAGYQGAGPWTVEIDKEGDATITGPSAETGNVIRKVWNWIVGIFTGENPNNLLNSGTLTVTNQKKYTVTYMLKTGDGAFAADGNAETYVTSAQVTLRAVDSPENYSFSGWKTDENLSTAAVNFEMPGQNVVLYGALTILPSYVVQANYFTNTDGAGDVKDNENPIGLIQTTYGDAADYNIKTADYSYGGNTYTSVQLAQDSTGTLNGGAVSGITPATPTTVITLNFYRTVNNPAYYTVTHKYYTVASDGSETEVTGADGTYTTDAISGVHGDKIEASSIAADTKNSYYEVTSRSGDIILSSSNVKNITITYKHYFYTVTTSGDNGLATLTPTATYDKGQNASVSYSLKPGYEIASFQVDGMKLTTPGTQNFNNIRANHSVAIKTRQIGYTLSVNYEFSDGTSHAGFVNGRYDDATYYVDSDWSVSAKTAPAGYTFDATASTNPLSGKGDFGAANKTVKLVYNLNGSATATVKYVAEIDGQTLEIANAASASAVIGQSYDLSDAQTATINYDGKIYDFVSDDSATAGSYSGTMPSGGVTITRTYAERARHTVTVNYVSEDTAKATLTTDPYATTPAYAGSSYDVSAHIPATITDANGREWHHSGASSHEGDALRGTLNGNKSITVRYYLKPTYTLEASYTTTTNGVSAVQTAQVNGGGEAGAAVPFDRSEYDTKYGFTAENFNNDLMVNGVAVTDMPTMEKFGKYAVTLSYSKTVNNPVSTTVYHQFRTTLDGENIVDDTTAAAAVFNATWGSTITLSDYSLAGQTGFAGYAIESTTPAGGSINAGDSGTIHYLRELVTVVFEMNGGVWNGSADNVSYPVVKNNALSDAQSIPAPVRSGYNFMGWAVDVAGATTDGEFTRKTTFTAEWEAIPYIPDSTYYNVTVNYINNADGASLRASHSERRPSGSNYDVSAYDAVEINGYTYDRTEGDALRGALNSDKVINVYYTATTEIPDETPPLDPTPVPSPGENPDQPPVDIGEDPSPLAPVPGGTEIDDDETPLVDAPKTGDKTNLGILWVLLTLGLGGLGLCAAQSIRHKKRSGK